MEQWIRRILVFTLVIGFALVAFPHTTQAQGIEELLYQELERSVLEDAPTTSKRSALVRKSTGTVSCLPTCDITDGRFLALSPSSTLDTLSDDNLEFELAVPADATSFSFGVFDGDTGATSGGSQHWDFGTASLDLTLIADPLADGSGSTVIQTWTGVAAPDNDWIDFSITPGPDAQAPSGNYFYRLRVALSGASASALNAFKLRTDCVVTVEVFQQPIGFIAQIASLADAQIIFPLYPAPIPTTYDGTLEFNLSYPVTQDEIAVWGGDMDHGDFTGLLTADTDDPDTPNNVLPPWAGPGAVLEGVAVGSGLSTGAPADDRNPVGLGAFLLRAPSVTWEIETPSGAIFSNGNPSGNREWEQFRITEFPSGDADFDNVGPLAPGAYTVRMLGLDMQNLNAFYFFRPLVCVSDVGVPCQPLFPYAVGDTVFEDLDGDGVQDAGEPGIAGVVIEVLDAAGYVVFTGTTDADGNYLIGVENGEEYTVRPAAENFDLGGPLDGTIATTADTMTTTIQDANDLTLDFGFRGTGSIGDRVWLDTNQNGQFDDGANAGIGGVVLTLTGLGPDGAFGTADDVDYGQTATDADGLYSFDGLFAGSYRVDVDDSTVPAGYVLVSGSDPADVTVAAGEMNDDVDFGYFAADQYFADIRPILECVSTNGDGTYTAFFGYLNENDVEVGIPVGSNNRFSPAPEDRGQPETFAPGRTEFWPNASFSVDFDGSNLVWTLGNRTSTASANSTPCAYHVFIEKEWRDDKSALFAKGGSHHGGGGSSRTDVRIEAVSEFGTAVCTVEKDSETLKCDYDNDSPATDDNGLWVPVGTSYTVTETEQRDGWEATAGTGTFTIGPDGPDYCEPGRDGIAKFCTHTVVNEPEGHSGPGNKGWIWWKHNPHQWPGTHIKVGHRIYSMNYARYIMRYASFSDVRYNLFREVVAAKLNRAVGNDSSCVDYEIAAADYYLYYTLKTSGVWHRMDDLRRHLARYNAGQLCAPPRH